MAVHQPNPTPNAFVRVLRRLYHPLGFKKGYNFTLYFIFTGALLGFCLAKLSILDIDGYWKKTGPPGEYFWYSQTFYKAMLILHLACILPAGILVIFQFAPVIRHKLIIFHRVNGYAILLLLLLSNIGACAIGRRAFGGSLATQMFVGVLALGTTISSVLAYTNIKRLQIDQHRAWMLRTWFYAGSIITLRLIMIVMAGIISKTGQYFDYYHIMRCEKIIFTAGLEVANTYAACAANPNGLAIVRANLSQAQNVVEAAAALEVCFAAAGWLAFIMHAVGVEVYLQLTGAESERLRIVSYERQLARGMTPTGSAGLTADKLGDAEEWRPPAVDAEKAVDSRHASPVGESVGDDQESMKVSSSSNELSRPQPALGWR
ncbi:hypothetical protein LTR53_004563 [Teratosphaeriaceae sp. CCFEE 6253]|nr:hypothetical protein LTR53_004563 [Teratosphaeriaceae sp. CCFEE 6253]